MFRPDEWRKDKNMILDAIKDFGKVRIFKPTTEKTQLDAIVLIQRNMRENKKVGASGFL